MIVTLRRKDGLPLYCFRESISAWTAAVGEDRECCNVWIGGKVWTTGNTVDEVTQLLRLVPNGRDNP